MRRVEEKGPQGCAPSLVQAEVKGDSRANSPMETMGSLMAAKHSLPSEGVVGSRKGSNRDEAGRVRVSSSMPVQLSYPERGFSAMVQTGGARSSVCVDTCVVGTVRCSHWALPRRDKIYAIFSFPKIPASERLLDSNTSPFRERGRRGTLRGMYWTKGAYGS
jgi:hypothetical protein